MQAAGFHVNGTVYTCDWLNVAHYRFHINTCVYNVSEGYPQFGIVKNIIFCSLECYFVLNALVTLSFMEHFHAYEIQPTDNHLCWAVAEIKDHHPCVVHNIALGKPNREYKLVQTRYMIV